MDWTNYLVARWVFAFTNATYKFAGRYWTYILTTLFSSAAGSYITILLRQGI